MRVQEAGVPVTLTGGRTVLYGPNSTVPGLETPTPLLGPGFGRHVLGSEACGSGTRWLGSARGHPNAPNWCVWSVLSGHLWYEESTFKVVRLMSPLPPSPPVVGGSLPRKEKHVLSCRTNELNAIFKVQYRGGREAT